MYDDTLTLPGVLPEPVPAGPATAAALAMLRGSVSELERIASSLRDAGEPGTTDIIELRIINLLEQKITRKLLAQGRRRQTGGRSAA